MKTENMTAAPTAHTPIPWSISADGQRIISADGESVIADVHGAACADQEGASNARLIVRAVNSHAELLAALRSVVSAVDAMVRDQYAGRDPLDLAPRSEDRAFPDLREARAAIARAEGRT